MVIGLIGTKVPHSVPWVVLFELAKNLFSKIASVCHQVIGFKSGEVSFAVDSSFNVVRFIFGEKTMRQISNG